MEVELSMSEEEQLQYSLDSLRDDVIKRHTDGAQPSAPACTFCHLLTLFVFTNVVFGVLFPSCCDTVGWMPGRTSGLKVGCWFVRGDDLTGAFHLL